MYTFFSRLIYLFTHIIPILVIAITIANILSELGLINRISWIVNPIVKIANLSPESGVVIITYIASGNAGSAMLSNFYEQGIISERETIITSFVSSFFSFLNHVFIYFIPVVIPLLGLKAGLLYILARMFVSLCITITAIVAGHFLLEKKSWENKNIKKKNETKRKSIKKGIKKALKVLRKILPRLILVYSIVILMMSYGVFKPLESFRILGLPGQVSAIVAAGVADTTSGFAAAGSLLSSGVITPTQAVAALLLTSIISMSVVFVRHSLPGRIAYFGFRLGVKIAIISSLLNIFYTAIALAILLW